MGIDKNMEGDTLTIKLTGRLDTTTSDSLEKELSLENVKTLIFDLEKLEYISSSGLRILLSSQKQMNNKGKMIVKNISGNVKEVLDITGFSSILNIE